MIRKITLFLALFISATTMFAQTGSGTLEGKLTDKATNEPLPFVNVILERDGNMVQGATTDFDGKFVIKPLEPGDYDLKVSYVGYSAVTINGITINANKITTQNVPLSAGIEMDEVVISYERPLVDADQTSSGGVVDAKEIGKMPSRSVEAIAQTVAGVSSAGNANGEVSIRGSRTGGNFVYIDGIKVRGSNNLPKSAMQEISVITSGVPANYGDAVGGIISITTKGASSVTRGGFEINTSGVKVGDEVVGLDAFGNTTIEANMSGPILWKYKNPNAPKDQRIKDRPLVGYFFAANYTGAVEGGRRSPIGYNVISQDSYDQLMANPLSRTDGGLGDGVLYNSELTRSSDYFNQKISNNTQQNNISLNGKLDFTFKPTVNLTLGGRYIYRDRDDYSFVNTLMNWDENSRTTNIDYSVYGRFTQRFIPEKDSKSKIKYAYYSLLVDYSRSLNETRHKRHEDNFFDYGYVGKFDLYKNPEIYEFKQDAQGNPYRITRDLPADTLVEFTAGDKNPILANYTNAYYELFDGTEGNYDKLDNFVNRGLRNGDAAKSVYGRWNNIGTPTGTYRKEDNSQVRVSASGTVDLGNHGVSVGFEYEQRVDRLYQIRRLVGDENFRGRNIWAIGRNLVNSHLNNLDRSDSTQISGGTVPTYEYGILVDSENQSTFDRNLRTSLGLDVNGDDLINIDALDPSQLSIDFFSPDELLNNGQFLTTYYGFDPYGNKYDGTTSLNSYINEVDEFGDFTRNVGAFEPVYFAGYIMDKFSFDDIKFNVGVRVDRFDANQPVLKDRFLFADARTRSELAGTALAESNLTSAIPDNIGDDYVVYVDNIRAPQAITGFRDGDVFYNAAGQIVKSDLVAGSSGEIEPFLFDQDKPDVDINAFEDYKPQVNVMPRISFSFPISEEAGFFAHYDILTRRPTPVTISRLDIVRYQYIRNLGSNANNPINNPNLLPEKTIDYEIGFQQGLTENSALKIAAFYREMRDQIQTFQNVGAYPQDYYSYQNLDFGTVKGLSLGYDLRRTANISLNVNYTLQFAEGTGTSFAGVPVNLNSTDFSTLRTISPLNNDQRHRFNARIDYRFLGGDDYNGPVVFGKKIFQNAGANFVANLGSGTPYSSSTDPKIGQPKLNGSINGSRLPWNFTTNVQIDKSFSIEYGKKGEGAKAKYIDINAYLLINNLFNTLNVTDVYRYTGNPDDDGYLTDARYQNEISQQNDEQSFRDLYTLSRLNPVRYGSPRTIQIGAVVSF